MHMFTVIITVATVIIHCASSYSSSSPCYLTYATIIIIIVIIAVVVACVIGICPMVSEINMVVTRRCKVFLHSFRLHLASRGEGGSDGTMGAKLKSCDSWWRAWQ